MRRKVKKTSTYYEAVGRRRSAVARVRLYLVQGKKDIKVGDAKIKKGDIVVNEKQIIKYFPLPTHRVLYERPLRLTDSLGRFAISVIARGGGKTGQLNAVILGFSRALQKVDESYRSILKREGLLTRDSRIRERRKVGMGGKARRKKQSPKR